MNPAAPADAPLRTRAARPAAGRTTSVAGTAVLLLLAGTALFDRPFALIGVPGVPLYVTELVLVIAVVELALRPEPLKGWASTRWMAPLMVMAFLVWGGIRFAGSLGHPVLDVVRDSALVYYALFALIAFALTGIDERFTPQGLVRVYGRFVPFLLVVAPVRLVFSSVPSLQGLGPNVPGSDIPFLGGHRPANVAVQVALAVVFLASNGRRDRATVIGIVAGVFILLLAATQTRSGFLAGGSVIVTGLLLWGRRLRFRWTAALAVLACLGVIAWGLDVRIQSGQRDISASQLLENVKSLAGDQNTGSSQLSDTESFRTQLWNMVIDATDRTGQLENGWGFGPNLGSSFLPTHEDQALRNPHNSHLTIFVRLGVIGATFWAVLLVSWYRRVGALALRGRRRHPEGLVDSRVAMLLCAVAAGILLNAFFDPTLETPMVAVWLWSVLGLGIGLVLRPLMAARRGPGWVDLDEPLNHGGGTADV